MTWIPRPRAVDEPACWSWPVPPLRDLDAELAVILAGMAQVPPDEQLSEGSLRLAYPSAEAMRWLEFHSGVRACLPGGGTAPARCAICGRTPPRMVTDHDHATGLVRGILCGGCNTSEGLGGQDAYVDQPPAAILGLQAYYVGGFGWKHGWWLDQVYARRITYNRTWTHLDGVAPIG